MGVCQFRRSLISWSLPRHETCHDRRIRALLPLMKLPKMPSSLRASIKRLLHRLRYDASVRITPESFDLAPGETRSDVEWIQVQPDVTLKVYWKILPIGKGPAVSLYVFEFQILRFDCFGARDGHFHLLLGWPSP